MYNIKSGSDKCHDEKRDEKCKWKRIETMNEKVLKGALSEWRRKPFWHLQKTIPDRKLSKRIRSYLG